MVLAMVAAIAIPFAAIGGVSATSGLFAPYAIHRPRYGYAGCRDRRRDGRRPGRRRGNREQGFADYRIYVLAGQPDGTLAAPTSYVTAGSGTHPLQSVAVGDITDDGRADVIVAASSLGIQVLPAARRRHARAADPHRHGRQPQGPDR